MNNTIYEKGSVPIKIWTNRVEDSALKQLKNLSRLPFIDRHGIAVMPDVHTGIGSTIGSVIPTHKAIIPSSLGVDIGCGMCAIKLSLTASDLPYSLAELRSKIEEMVPVGFNQHKELPRGMTSLQYGHVQLAYKIKEKFDFLDVKKSFSQLGTLGGGNHFIEVCLDESNAVWVMLHSGSRGIGNIIGKHFIEKAKRRMEEYFISLPDKDLAYFPEESEDFKDYIEMVSWAQEYAFYNREMMMSLVLKAMRIIIPKKFCALEEAINCHHNYVEKENHFGKNMWITRKGAIRARENDLGIIPGSMGQKSYIVKGKGNPDSYCSCSHGAGRVMSRTEASKTFTLEDLKNQTMGVECRKDVGVIDEAPFAYKNIDVVMNNQKDLIEVVHTLKQVICIKG